MEKISATLLGLFLCLKLVTANNQIKGTVKDDQGRPLVVSNVVLKNSNYSTVTDDKGVFVLDSVVDGDYTLIVFSVGFSKHEQQVEVKGKDIVLTIELKSITKNLPELVVQDKKDNAFGIGYLKAIEGTAIYASKKNEVILVDDVAANKSTNNARQIYAKVAGINVWESDAGGIQLGVGGRGLNPNRTTNFNTRQNGYDISADALGYPESYYTPPTEAVERIDVIRGAASLQYGTQFGGVLNFKLKKGADDKRISLTARQTMGSFGLSNSFISVGGTKGTVNYSTFYQHKRGDGWRENSGFESNTAFFQVSNQFSEKLKVGMEYTYMHYLAQQAGGVTDRQMLENPRLSTRDRNWFKIDWNLAAAFLSYELSDHTLITSKLFGLYASRNALGELGRIDRPDPLLNRSLISGDFKNYGNETRLLHQYQLNEKVPSALVVGARLYKGNNSSRQGGANDEYGADFYYLDERDLLSDYQFENDNAALFAENLFNITQKISITPGARYEYIRTQSDGMYNADVLHPNTQEVLLEIDSTEQKSTARSILLLGVGGSYKPIPQLEVYANFSQNYRAINFSDIRIVNPNFRVDENMEDETGWNGDVGFRGRVKNFLSFDATAFYLRYNNRIGAVLQSDSITYQTYRYRTNIGNTAHLGLESFVELDVLKLLLSDSSRLGFSVFSNISLIDARYTTSLDASVKEGNKVEYAPVTNLKAGATFSVHKIKVTYQFTHVSEQFTEATNAVVPVATATDGLIPAYNVMDLSFSCNYKRYQLEMGVNNLTGNNYFTRRATAYPGPGIIPAQGRNFFVTLQVRL